MRRTTITRTVAGLVATSALLAAAPLAPASEARRAASEVVVTACSREEASATFNGRMRATSDSERMSMRFTLLERGGSGRYLPVKAPGLGRWLWSGPGVAVFSYRQEVLNLAANLAYRARVDYRWHTATGAVLHRKRRRSRPCRQYLTLPNLRVRMLHRQPTDMPGVVLYRVRLSNAGEAAATATGVRLEVDGLEAETRPAAALAPAESRIVTFRGPQCQSSARAVVDPDGLVAETAENDNAHGLPCADLAARR